MAILLDHPNIPESGIFDLYIDQRVEINVTAKEARKKVRVWLMSKVAMGFWPDEPTLLVGERSVWQIPIFLTAPHVGKVGQVGTVYVDVADGSWDASQAITQQFFAQGKILAKKIPPFEPRELQADYLAKIGFPTLNPTT